MSIPHRRLSVIVLLMLSVAVLCNGQQVIPVASRADLEPALAFEAPLNGTVPGGWGSYPPETVSADDRVVHGGKHSACLKRDDPSPNGFSTITKALSIDFAGKSVELRGYLRTEEVSEFTGLWMREDGDTPTLAFDNMQSRQIKGSTDWTEYSITLPLHPEAKQLYFGVLIAGKGKTWADDLQLLVDGKPIWDAPKVLRKETVLDRDHEFDKGSNIEAVHLSSAQIDNLVTLGKVWGFVKYHYPKVTAGEVHWDYELFRVLPPLLKAKDRAAANDVIVRWIHALGPIEPCKRCAKLDQNELQLAPELDWISDKKVLGEELTQTLLSVHENRPIGRQFYITMAPGVGNPVFEHEPSYDNIKLPDFGYQLLAVYRFWNAVEHWSPYRDVIGESWDGVLSDAITRVALAPDGASYKRELQGLIAKLHDGHANLWTSLDVIPPGGPCRLPVMLRFVENHATVGRVLPDAGGFKVGDVIVGIDGTLIQTMVEGLQRYYGASNSAGMQNMIARALTRGSCSESEVTAKRANEDIHLKVARVPLTSDPSMYTHDLPGPAFRLLSKDIAYLKLSSVKNADSAKYISDASGTKALIIDIRNYPSEFMVFALGSLLVERETPFVRFTTGDLNNPGAFHWAGKLSVPAGQPNYSGKVVILVDETSMSQAEYTTMAFRVAPRAVVVGSTTAGADGNVSPLLLPGGLRTMISGIGVYYPDKRPTQRVGIVPDIISKPTIEGIRKGRDEVLEEAIRQVLGPKVSASDIEKLARGD
jgi:C-terminal processing protease CtpA/Prc